MKTHTVYLRLTLIIILLFPFKSFSKDWDRLINLQRNWKFSIGDNKEWASSKFNDSQWEKIYVPSSWENEGFNGYNGYAWYRITFDMPRGYYGGTLYLSLGRIDDVDETYFNGKLIGRSGSFPPDYQTTYYAFRRYPIPEEYINISGDNVIAVRVYDSELEGGIVEGDIGIYAPTNTLIPDLSLEGEWKFNLNDDEQWKEKNYNDKDWNSIIVPGNWESQGYKDYDGFAWYRKKFSIPKELLNQRLVILMGRIDDYDEVYINGNFAGSTGNINNTKEFQGGQEYAQFRGYYLPDDFTLKEKDNVIAVRVWDGYKEGGIYEGPIGLITQQKYIQYWKEYKNKNKGKKNIFDMIWGE